MKKLFFLLFSVLTILSCASQNDDALKDLAFVRSTILENHPGVYNHQDPDFCSKLEIAYAQAQSIIAGTKEPEASHKALTCFTQSFNDPHLWVHWTNKSATQLPQSPKKITFSIFPHNVAWIEIPTFALRTEELNHFEECLDHIAILREKNQIVFDLRGNQGGNSDYGSQIIDALFSEKYAQQQRNAHNSKMYVDWRASQGNVAHIASFLKRNPTNDWLQKIAAGLQQSLAQGHIFYTETCAHAASTGKYQSTAATSAEIIIVTDSVNVSAALDFIDELKMMSQQVTLVGQKTKADRLYMEVRSLPLPSGLGSFSFPIKVYRNRPRLDNQPYYPDIEFTDIANTKALECFILEKICQKKY